MAKRKKQRGSSEGKISKKTVKEKLIKSQEELLDEIDLIETERNFSKRVLDKSNNVISFFVPVKDKVGKVVDFRIEYVNERMREVTDEDTDSVIGTMISDYSNNTENGVFEELTRCYETGETKEFEKKFTFGGKNLWFALRLVKLDNGILIFAKDISKEKELEVEIEVQNRLLSEAEYVANTGSYKWNLDEEIIYYSDNAYRLFGHEPGDFEPSVDKFMSFVHPNDKPKLMADFATVMERKERTESKYRIITKAKNIKTISTIGEFYQKNGDWYMVGVMADVSEQVAAELRLKNRNQELKRINNELESFNRIASHDLQEPLRKIQMFISRLDEESSDKLDERGKKYLGKVTSSVERMRELISNLLSYSRIETVEETPDKVDLNDVLENVQEDLAERISELGATIHAEPLPSVAGIKFQLEQLFSNLIGNALKYKKSDTAPVVEISSEILSYSKIDSSLALPRSRYLKLQFKDNGIGFDPEHKEKIFDIFQRLHSKNEFSGTGLGLAICRKIVQSHSGAIKAEGVAGQGATFTVYLPYSA